MVHLTARQVAYETLLRIDHDGAYANLVTSAALDRADLDDRDRRFVTELVYGTTRGRRSCDAQIDRHVDRAPAPALRTLLRLGVYQLIGAGVPAHAAVSETVALAPRPQRGFVNAVLRRVAASPPHWRSLAEELSYPDWIVDRLITELGHDQAIAVLAAMNRPQPAAVRADGYVQGLTSNWVADAVGGEPGETIIDLCAAPGGKATAIAASGARVIAADLRRSRAAMIVESAHRTARSVAVVAADARYMPLPPGVADAVVLDAPCSGLGALRRRADARWRVSAADVSTMARLQGELLRAAADLVRPGGRLVYSVCTLTAEESIAHPVPDGFDVDRSPPPGEWEAVGHGWRALPDHGDGMMLIRFHRR